MSQEKIFQFRRRFDSLYWQQFLLTAGMVLLTLLLLGVSFYGLSYNDTVAERRSEMRQHAELIANMSGDYLASNGQTQSPSLQNLVALAAGLTKADFLLCNQEGYALLTSDQRLGGKVVSVPQDIQDAILGDQGFYQGRSSIGGAYDLKQFVVGVPVTREDGSTVPFTPLNADNFCIYDNTTGTVTLKPASTLLFRVPGSEGGYGEPVQVDVYLWLEGCDEDCTVDLAGQTMELVSLIFAGL